MNVLSICIYVFKITFMAVLMYAKTELILTTLYTVG